MKQHVSGEQGKHIQDLKVCAALTREKFRNEKKESQCRSKP